MSDNDTLLGQYEVNVSNYRDDHIGNCIREEWSINGVIHNPFGPAVVLRSRDWCVGEWYDKEGLLHRDNAPAFIRIYGDNPSIEMYDKGKGYIHEQWFTHGIATRSDNPALLTREDGLVLEEKWILNGKEHRVDGPSYISREPDTGVITLEQWMRADEFHREDGPAFIERDERTGIMCTEEWARLDGKSCRSDGGYLSIFRDRRTGQITEQSNEQHYCSNMNLTALPVP